MISSCIFVCLSSNLNLSTFTTMQFYYILPVLCFPCDGWLSLWAFAVRVRRASYLPARVNEQEFFTPILSLCHASPEGWGWCRWRWCTEAKERRGGVKSFSVDAENLHSVSCFETETLTQSVVYPGRVVVVVVVFLPDKLTFFPSLCFRIEETPEEMIGSWSWDLTQLWINNSVLL